jgi:hypothetical protein
MKVSFMITNGGPHPADKWAEQTVEAILDLIQIVEDSVTPEAAAARQAKRDLRPILFNIFNGHHGRVQKHEQDHMKANVRNAKAAAEYIERPIDVEPHLSVMDKVKIALSATPFKDHFAKPEVIEVVKQMVSQHTADVMHIERRWHHDRHLAAAKGA